VSAVVELLDGRAAISRRAWPTRSRRDVQLHDDARQLVLFQFAGNDFSVIGAAFGRPGDRPDHLITCTDPLERNSVAAELEPLRDDLAAWLAAHPAVPTVDRYGNHTFDAAACPQLVVAGGGVITALDNLAYDWRYNPALDDDWHDVGYELWTLVDQRHRPGQSAVIPLAETLARHFAFGLSPIESLKLAATVAICDAGAAGLPPDQLRAAELLESGPLGRPDELDEPVWAAIQAGRRTPPVVRATLRDTWERCSRAWAHLRHIPEAACTARPARATAIEWAKRIGPHRTNSPYIRRRALPTLANAAKELAKLESATSAFAAELALEDPLVAAGLVADGKGLHANVRFTVTRLGPNSATADLNTTIATPTPPATGTMLGLSGTNVRAIVRSVTPSGLGTYDIRLTVGGNGNDGTSGIRTVAGTRTRAGLSDGWFWLVPVPRNGPPPLSAPNQAPITHPFANGRPAVGGDDDADAP
jgi:hypothetical protein